MIHSKTPYKTLTGNNFRKEVLQSKRPVMVEITAGWCGACHIMAPIIDKLAREYRGRVKVGRLDIEANEEVAKELGVNELPFLLFFKHGQLVDHIIGSVPRKMIAEKLNALLAPGSGPSSRE